MSEPLSIAQVDKLVEDGVATITKGRFGNRPFLQDLIQFRTSPRKYQLTKNMVNGIKPLSKEILFGKLLNGGSVTIKIVNDEIEFEYWESS